MSLPDPSARILVAAFFDAPGLLAVRFKHSAGGYRNASVERIAAFATQRRPDTGALSVIGNYGGVLVFGLVAAFVAVPMLRSCGSASGDYAPPAIAEATATDCRQRSDWAVALTSLANDLEPTRPDLRPWAVRTLLDVPKELARRGDPTGGWLKPRCSAADRAAFSQGARLAAVLGESGSGDDLAVILDLPGSQAIAAAAGMASRFEPVITIDNLPHPSGVVPSAQTLAAAVYWRAEFSAARGRRPLRAPPVFVLEGDRLAPYHDEIERFDNRSFARLPDAAGFKALGITRILYVRPHRGDVVEVDDLNELLTALPVGGVEVRHLALETMGEPALVAPAPAATGATATPSAHSHWFWQRYGWYRPAGSSLSDIFDADARYHSVSRQTVFSSRPATAPPLDGGERFHESVYSRLVPALRPTSTDSDSDGGSWSRSNSYSSG